MEDQSFGVYRYYFNFVKLCGVFPFKVPYPGTHLEIHRGGIWSWFYYINFIGVLFSTAFQFVQLLLTMAYEPLPLNVVTQLGWMFAILIPFSNQMSFIRQEERVVQSVDCWCQLERSIIGSALRNLPNMPQGPMLEMSACQAAQTRLFKKSAFMYAILTLIAFTGMTLHIVMNPRFPAYVYSVSAVDDEILKNLSIAYQIWLLFNIATNVFASEIICILSAGSIVHCIENLCFRGSVVMSNSQCDMPHLDQVFIKNWAAFESKSKEAKGSATIHVAPSKDNLPQDSLAHVVQNVVDIQYALDRFKDVEAVVDTMNNSFGSIIFHHQSVYMSLMCTVFYTAIRDWPIMSLEGKLLLGVVALYYAVRLFMFFPAMGRVNVMSYTFVESWMEGLRHIPKGKYAYEFYMHKLESCRKLAYDSGGFFLMQKGTVLTFVSIVTTHVIVLLQLY